MHKKQRLVIEFTKRCCVCYPSEITWDLRTVLKAHSIEIAKTKN